MEMKTPTTANQWQIYASMKGSAGVARALSSGLRKTFIEIEQKVNGGKTIKIAAVEATSEVLKPVMSRYSSFGSVDTEPRNVATFAVLDFLEARYGIKRPDYDLGDAISDSL